ncbi:MAG: PAS domain S-box protein [Pyrinomonadaceae bacterium]
MAETQDNRDERILILAPIGKDATMAAQHLQAAGLRAEACDGVEEVCEKMREGAGVIFLTGEALTFEAMRYLAEAVAQQPAWSDIPLVVLTSGGAETPDNNELMGDLVKTCNVTLIERPVRLMTLLSAVNSALRARQRQYDLRKYLLSEERTREALERSEEKYRSLLENANDIIYSHDLAGNYLTINRACEVVTGYTRDEILGGLNIAQVVVPEQLELAKRMTELKLRDPSPTLYEIDINTKRGRRLTLEVSTRVSQRPGHEPIIEGIARDITERKHAEEAVRESEQQLRTLANAVPLLTWMAEPDGNIFWYNQRWYDYTGTTPREMQGWGWQSVHDPEVLPHVLERWRASVASGEPFEMEFPLKSAGGDFRSFLTRVTPLRDEEGRVVRWFGTNTDVEELRRALKQAEDANRMKDEFLATLSHELRTPLTSILGWARMLSSGRLAEADTGRALETIERNAIAQSQLIEDILDVSRVITGKLRLEVQTVNLTSVIQSSVDAVLPAAEAKGIRLQRVLDSGASMVSGDPARLQQVIWNLLSNAIKFTPKDGRVQVKLERINSHVEIVVADNGQGINPDVLPFIFERFRQADSTTTRSHGGLGLGLAIVRHLVEMHGGTVEVESFGEGHGSTFTVKLPLVVVRSFNVGRAGDAERVHPTASNGSHFNCPPELDGLRLLVVDDEEDTRILLKMVLEKCGASVTTASSAREALAALKELRPHVLISDLGMPEEDGYALIKKVRALPEEDGGQTPSAALTAYARVEDRMKVLRSGFQIHITKPVEPGELVAVVANLAGRISM